MVTHHKYICYPVGDENDKEEVWAYDPHQAALDYMQAWDDEDLVYVIDEFAGRLRIIVIDEEGGTSKQEVEIERSFEFIVREVK